MSEYGRPRIGVSTFRMRPAEVSSTECSQKSPAVPVMKSDQFGTELFEARKNQFKHYAIPINGVSIDLYLTADAYSTLVNYSKTEPGTERDIFDENGPNDTLCDAVKKGFKELNGKAVSICNLARPGFKQLSVKLHMAGCQARPVEDIATSYVVQKQGERISKRGIARKK